MADSVPDVSPLAALKDLDSLHLDYLYVRDISCLRGLKLVNLKIWSGGFNDVSVLQSHPLQTLSLKQMPVSDFSVLKGKALQDLDLEWCDRLSDISFIKGMPLKYLNVSKTKVRDLSLLAGLPLNELVCDPEAKLDPALLASIPTLKKINLKPVSEWLSGSRNPPPPSETQGKVIDLLALVDVKRDTIAGDWVRTAEGLAKQGPGTTDKGAPRLQLPYQPPEEYDFEVEFTAVGDNQSVGQILSAQSRVFSWIVAGNKAEAPTAGFELFDNEPTSRPSEVVAPMEENLKAGRRYVSRVEVRAGSVRGFLDGVKLVDWEGDFKRLSPGTTGTGNLRDDKHLGLRAARDVIFHKITVREITGAGKVDAGVRTTAPAAVVDATKQKAGKIDGKWRDGLGEWISSRGGNTDFKTDESGRQVVQNNWIDIWLPVGPDEQKPLNGSIRAKAKGGKFRLSHRTHRDGVHGGVVFSYGAGFEGDQLKIWKFEDQKATYLPGANYPLPGKFDPSAFYELEFRATGSLLELFLNGERVLTGHDSSPVPGHFRFGADKGVVVESVEIRIDGFGDDKRMQGDLPASRAPVKTESSSVSSSNPSAPSPTSWTDWLTPRLARGQFKKSGYVVEKDGITTDQDSIGTDLAADNVVITEGTIRLTYLLRDSKGAQIVFRNRATQEMYMADDSGSELSIRHVLGNKTTILTKENYPATLSHTGERTLEFRVKEDAMKATVNGTFSLSAQDAKLATDPGSFGAFLIRKGLLLKKVEVAD
jgi:hypothetical protein